jgi:hypothetical protein
MPFTREWGEISMICVARVNHKRVVYWFFDSTKLKNMPEKYDTWHGAMVSPQQSVVIF